tara:strand:+ start:96 stop:698 length:603 start_codon:yes stop_codon:yes gene_type:complete
MARINRKQLERKAIKILLSEKKGHTQRAAFAKAKKIFNQKRAKLISDYDNHPITKELRGGAGAQNLSGTLNGYGNLYTFIGFPTGSGDPTAPISNALRYQTRIERRGDLEKRGRSLQYSFRVFAPDKNELAQLAPMPWEGGSWLLRIERGISGLGYYIYRNFIEKSRSGSGIQTDNKIRNLSYKRTSYISAILNTFNKSI